MVEGKLTWKKEGDGRYVVRYGEGYPARVVGLPRRTFNNEHTARAYVDKHNAKVDAEQAKTVEAMKKSSARPAFTKIQPKPSVFNTPVKGHALTVIRREEFFRLQDSSYLEVCWVESKGRPEPEVVASLVGYHPGGYGCYEPKVQLWRSQGQGMPEMWLVQWVRRSSAD